MAGFRIPSDYQNQVSKSTHKWNSPVGGTIHPGLAYPVHHRHLNTGDRIRGKIEALIQSQPMRGPLLNGFKQVTIATFTPDSVLYGWMRNGIRFSPDQYQKFSKWHFVASGDNLGTYTDPVFGTKTRSSRLSYGLDPATGAYGTPYDLWSRDDVYDEQNDYPHVGRGGLWDWLGVAAGAVAPCFRSSSSAPFEDSASFKWNLSPFVSYFLSCYYYIANMQEDYMYFTRSLPEIGFDGPKGHTFAELPFNQVFCSINPSDFVDVLDQMCTFSSRGNAGDFANEASAFAGSNGILKMLSSALGAHGGLISVPYNPDLFGNIIKQGSSPTAEIDVITATAAGETEYAVAVPELRLQTKIQNMLDRLFVSGGRFGDVLRTLWGTKSSPYVNKPDFLGVWQAGVNPSNVVATSNGEADGESANVGQMAARIDRYEDFSRSQGIDYYAKEPGTVMFISMLVPDPAYCQGLHPDLYGSSFADDFNPELGGIGFQSVPRSRFSLLPAGFSKDDIATSAWFRNSNVTLNDPDSISVGEEVAWSWLRTDYPRLHGEFGQNGSYQYWTLVRRFSEYYVDKTGDTGTDVEYSDYHYFGTYINPLSWQYLFAGASLADPNFTFLAQMRLSVVSSVPSTYMPYLGR